MAHPFLFYRPNNSDANFSGAGFMVHLKRKTTTPPR
jgi:hypothetical protein